MSLYWLMASSTVCFFEAVLQLKGDDGQAVDEESQIQGQLGVVVAIAQLAGYGEPVQTIERFGRIVARRRRAVEQVDLVRAVLDTVAQNCGGAPLGDLPLEPGQEFAPGDVVVAEVEGGGGLRLCGVQKLRKLDDVHAVLTVVVVGVAVGPAHTIFSGSFSHREGLGSAGGLSGQVGADEAFEALFGGVGGHV